MTDEQFQERAAEFLSGEMNEPDRQNFRAELERSPARAQLFRELEAAQRLVRNGAPSLEQAEQRTRHLPVPAAPSTASRRTSRLRPNPLAFVLRYAAVIALAFCSGYLVRDIGAAGQPTQPTRPEHVDGLGGFEARFARNYVQTIRQRPTATTFSRTLLALARR